jgi:hypothetical protein
VDADLAAIEERVEKARKRLAVADRKYRQRLSHG